MDGEEAEREAPTLNLPQLNTGLSESEVKDLAYLVFACNCSSAIEGEDGVINSGLWPFICCLAAVL